MDYVSRPNKDNEAVVVQTFLSKEQVDTLREKLSGDIQLLTYIMFGLSTMARVNACSNVKWEQVDFENRVVENVREKEGYIVNLYFSEEVKGLLLKLKDFYKENENNCEYVFNTKYGNVYNKVSNTTLNEWCKKAGSLIGVPSLHCHDLRHSGSQLLKLSGCPIEIISELLNHKGLDVTKQFYLRQDKQQMKSEKDKYNI